MKKYQCNKCGETAMSKQMGIRNTFPDDGMAAIMTNICNVITSRKENGTRKVTFEFPYLSGNDDDTIPDDKLEMLAVSIIRDLKPETVEHWLCNHDWTIIEDDGRTYS